MIYPIYTYGNDILRKRADDWPIPDILKKDPRATLHLKNIIDAMWETLHNAEGAGLALPQLGLPGRIIVIEEEINPGEIFKGVFFNAHIHNYIEPFSHPINEGCLSFPGLILPISRPEKIDVEWYDENWIYHREIFDGIKSRILQHEIEHLEGILFIDRILPEEKLKLFMKLEDIKNKKVKAKYLIK